MYEWEQQIQRIVNEIDQCIIDQKDEILTLEELAGVLGYSPFYTTRKFREISGMQFREYLRQRKLAFALRKVRDEETSLLDIALEYGFSSHEAFTRAFKKTYGITPSAYRQAPAPLVLRTKMNPFDRYFFGLGEIGMMKTDKAVNIYFVTIPAHAFLHIRNYESNGYWDFWQKQSQIPGQDCETICGLLDSIKGKLDDFGGSEPNSGSGQIMAYIHDQKGRLCDWGIPRSECYGVRLPADYAGKVPEQMMLTPVPEADYIVFEHGPFDYNQENYSVEMVMEAAMKQFNYAETDYAFDASEGRITYFYHDPARFFKYVRPVIRVKK